MPRDALGHSSFQQTAYEGIAGALDGLPPEKPGDFRDFAKPNFLSFPKGGSWDSSLDWFSRENLHRFYHGFYYQIEKGLSG